MAYPPGMELHGQGWRIVKRVPRGLLSHYAPHKFLKYQTKETDKKAAAGLAWRWLADLEEEFRRIRKTGSKYKQAIEQDEAAYLVRLMVCNALEADEEGRAAGCYASDEDFAAQVARLDAVDAETRHALSRRIFSGDLPMLVEDWLGHHGYDIPKDGEAFKRLCLEFAKGRAEAVRLRRLRNEGEAVEVPPEPVAPSVKPLVEPLRLSKVVERFLAKQDRDASMFKKYSVATALLLEVLGDRDVTTLKQMDLEDFAELLCRLPPRWSDKKRQMKLSVAQMGALEWPECIGPKTFEGSYMAALRPFFKEVRRLYADQGFPAHLTIEGIKYSGEREGGESKQRAFRQEELKRLYESAEYRVFAEDEAQEYCYWLPLLGLYTGARVNEVCQINPQCDIWEEAGVWFFDITEETPTDERVKKSVKNKTSRRKVPVHSALLGLGFLGYVKRMQSHTLLFPQLPPTRGKASGKAEKWFRKLLQEAGLRDETPKAKLTGFHAYRHTFLNRALNLGVDNAEWLTGHAEANVSSTVRGYRGEMELLKKQEIMERITFDISPPVLKRMRSN